MVVRVNRLGYKEGEDGYEETKDFDSHNLSYDEEVLEAKSERDKEEQLFIALFGELDKWNLAFKIPEENIKELKTNFNKQRIVKRFLSYGSGNPENYWDFFEMFDFICFLRVRHPDFMDTLLKDYKGGRFRK
jgi:hypothetical protein